MKELPVLRELVSDRISSADVCDNIQPFAPPVMIIMQHCSFNDLYIECSLQLWCDSVSSMLLPWNFTY